MGAAGADMPCGVARIRRWLGTVLVALAVQGPLAASGGAQYNAAALKQEYEALFQRVLRDPANLDLSFRFAEVATRLGDYEAAVGALERMAFYNPNLPRVKLELGVLYFRLGSYQMARSYFTSATEGSDVPADVRGRVDSFVREIDRRLAATQWSVFAQAGLRYQTNANAGPSSPLIRAAGQDAVLDQQFVKRPDWNAFGLVGVRHVYDFENQRGDVWETGLGGYYARQFKFERLNLGLIEINTGPRFALAPDAWPGLGIRPYALANVATLGDAPYLGTVGGGLSIAMPFSRGIVVEPFIEYRDRTFLNSRDYPTASDQSGQLWTAGLLAQGDLWGPAVRWQARLAGARNDARRGFNAYDQISADLAFPIEFDGLWPGTRKWTLLPTVGWSQTTYDQPNFIVDPFVRRKDREWRVGALLDAQIHDWFGLALQVQYTVVNSNLRNYDTNNLSVVFGPTVKF